MNTKAIRATVGCIGCLGLFLVSSGVAGDKSPRAAASPKLEKLRWMAGTWHTRQGADDLVEIWSEPVGDSMMGMFRWIKNGKVWMYELMSISRDDGELVFRLRHFDRKHVPWEDKYGALSYALTSQGEHEVAFENPERESPRRFTYRLDGDGALIIRLEGSSGGKPGVDEFRFQRQ